MLVDPRAAATVGEGVGNSRLDVMIPHHRPLVSLQIGKIVVLDTESEGRGPEAALASMAQQ
jgi:hypothetical protein